MTDPVIDNQGNPDVRTLLEQELQCFHQIMYKTQEVLDDSGSYSLRAILDLMDIRDFWIEKIKALEERQKLLGAFDENGQVEGLREQIQALAKSLVVTDAKLLDILQMKKLGVIKEMGKLAENKGESERTMPRNQQPRLIDTRRA